MTVPFFAPSTTRTAGQRPFRSRFEPCLSLPEGNVDFPITRVDPLFEDLPPTSSGFGTPTAWVVFALRKLAQSARQYDISTRPIHLPLPLACLNDEGLPETLRKAANAEDCCPQEFILEFQDATFAASDEEGLTRMENFRRKGFRIGLDSRFSSQTPFGARMRSAVERLRITENDLLTDEVVQHRAEIVSALGGAVIIERAHWKHVDLLKSYGATHTLKLIADA